MNNFIDFNPDVTTSLPRPLSAALCKRLAKESQIRINLIIFISFMKTTRTFIEGNPNVYSASLSVIF